MQILLYVLNVHYRITLSSFCVFTYSLRNTCPSRSCIVKALFYFLLISTFSIFTAINSIGTALPLSWLNLVQGLKMPQDYK